MRYARFAAVLAAMMLAAGIGQAAVTIDMVTVGHPGNIATMTVDSGYWGFPPRQAGAVDYEFQIGTYDVTAGQYTEFLNAKSGVVGTYSLYNTQMYPQADGCQIQDNGDGTYTAHSPNLPVNYISYGSAMRFVNWLDNGQGAGDTEAGVYDISGQGSVGDALRAGRAGDAEFFLPTLDEWVKAGHYEAGGGTYYDYPTSSNIAPTAEAPAGGANSANYNNAVGVLTDVGAYTGTTSPYGAFDMGGNVHEFVEAFEDWGWGLYTVVMGGDFNDPNQNPDGGDLWFSSSNDRGAGFRVAAPGDAGITGDFDSDGDVDADDINILCANMGGDPATYDVDEDGDVDEDDLTSLIGTLVEWDNGVDTGVGTKQGDFNLDGLINATDLAIMKGTFGSSGVGYADGNANCDTVVNATDLAILKTNFGFTAPTGGVPEPMTIGLLAVGACLGLFRRKRR